MHDAELARAGLQKKLEQLQLDAANATGRANQLKDTLAQREDELKKLALADPKVQPSIEGKQVVKVIVVPDKLVNIVVK